MQISKLAMVTQVNFRYFYALEISLRRQAYLWDFLARSCDKIRINMTAAKQARQFGHTMQIKIIIIIHF